MSPLTWKAALGMGVESGCLYSLHIIICIFLHLRRAQGVESTEVMIWTVDVVRIVSPSYSESMKFSLLRDNAGLLYTFSLGIKQISLSILKLEIWHR